MRPLVTVSVHPRSRANAERLQDALNNLGAEDPAFSFSWDAETYEAIIRAASEEDVLAYIEALRSVYAVEADIGCVQVNYLETISRWVETKHTHKRQGGGSGQYAEVQIAFEPTSRNAGVFFENKATAGAIPPGYVPVIEKAVRSQAQTGVRAGFPTVDFKFTLVDGKYHDVDSSAQAFEIAARACFRELNRTGSVAILEPVMRVQVTTPTGYADKIILDLKNRSAGVVGVELHGDVQVLTSSTPLKAVLGYAPVLSGLSDGKAKLSMHYESHREVILSKPPDDRFPPAMAMRA